MGEEFCRLLCDAASQMPHALVIKGRESSAIEPRSSATYERCSDLPGSTSALFIPGIGLVPHSFTLQVVSGLKVL